MRLSEIYSEEELKKRGLEHCTKERETLVEELEKAMKGLNPIGHTLEYFNAKELNMQDIMAFYIFLLEQETMNTKKAEKAKRTLLSAIRRGFVG